MDYTDAKRIENDKFWKKFKDKISIATHVVVNDENSHKTHGVRVAGSKITLNSNDLKKLGDVIDGHKITISRSAADFRMIIQ